MDYLIPILGVVFAPLMLFATAKVRASSIEAQKTRELTQELVSATTVNSERVSELVRVFGSFATSITAMSASQDHIASGMGSVNENLNVTGKAMNDMAVAMALNNKNDEVMESNFNNNMQKIESSIEKIHTRIDATLPRS